MKVRVNWIAEVSDDYRRAVRARYGQEGMATRDELKAWFRQNGESVDDDLMSEYRSTKEAEAD
jgi:hypothetical protein